MFPFFEAGASIAIAMTAFYALLATASLSVRFATRKAAPGMLSAQINAWWRIFPIVSLALLAYPFGIPILAGVICLLTLAELRPYWQDARPLILLLACTTTVAMLVLAAFTMLPFGPRINLAWLFYLFILTALNDIAQFVSGKLFGYHRIAPVISPNKTWQGLAGGIVISQLVSLALGSYLGLASPLTLSLYGLLLSIAGFAGDLLFSAAKRRLGIKDFSALIPGHGGILDRVDSLVLTAPLLYCLLRSINQGTS
jgi:phosphatidate cytidylyltransferase